MTWLFPLGLVGSVIAALFCGTMLIPLLVALLAAIGLTTARWLGSRVCHTT